MMSLNRYKLKHQAQANNKKARRVERLLVRTDRLIGLILIGNNLVNILASSIATILCIRLFGDIGIAIATFGLTVVILIFAEVTPKTLASIYPERIAFATSGILSILMRIFYPAVLFINAISNGLLKLLHIHPTTWSNDLSSDELRTLVRDAGLLIPQRHQNMLLSILDLETVTVDDIMVPRHDIYGVDINHDWTSITRQLINSPHTKVLVYQDSIDHAVGFIHARDALQLVMKDKLDKTALMRGIREIYFIPEATPLNVQLLKFQRNKERIGLVVDEYGDIQGLVTLDDILEEIVGDFTTTLTPTTLEGIHRQGDGVYIIDGNVNIRDLNKEMNWSLPTNGPRTLSGLVIEYLEDLPNAPVGLMINDYMLEIHDIEKNVIQKIQVIPPASLSYQANHSSSNSY